MPLRRELHPGFSARLGDFGGGTDVLLIHEKIQSQSTCGGYNQGWTSVLEKLDTYTSK